MRKYKLLSVGMLLLTFALSACGTTDGPNSSNQTETSASSSEKTEQSTNTSSDASSSSSTHTHTAGRVVEENKVEPTCTEDGYYDLVTYCSVDNEVMSSIRVTVPALGHNIVHHNRKEPTCTEDGNEAYDSCTRCSYSTYVKIPATGHTAGTPVQENYVAPTCTTNGSYDSVTYCSTDNVEISRETIPVNSLGHDWSTPTYLWANDYTSCTATRVCSRDANHIESEVATPTSTPIREATIDQTGIVRYTATFSNSAFATQTRDREYDPEPTLDKLTFQGNESGVIQTYTAMAASYDIVGEVIVPDSYQGLPVTRVSLYHCPGVTKVYLPSSINDIINSSFNGCSAEIVWSDNPTVTTFSGQAFDGYLGSTLFIPKSVTSIPDLPLWNATNLTSFVVDPENNYFTAVDGVLYNKDQTTLIRCAPTKAGEFVVPNTVTTIAPSAFRKCPLTSITIPNTVTSIGEQAFYQCSHLTSLSIPNSVTSLGQTAFGECTSLSSITLPSGLTSINYGTFQGCTSLSSISLPSGLTSIGSNAFSGCTSLSSIVIPSGVTQIPWNCFSDCTSLSSVTLSNGLLSIGMQAFYNCPLVSITIPSTVTTIDGYAFYNCTSLQTFELLSTTVSIGSSILEGCSSIESITVPFIGMDKDHLKPLGYFFTNYQESSNPYVHDDFNYNNGTIPESLNSVTILEGCSSISCHTFYCCNHLETISIPHSVTSIGDEALYGCTASLVWPNGTSLTQTGNMFVGYRGTTAVIPEGITTINTDSFTDCTSTSIVIAHSVTTIQASAFNGYGGTINWGDNPSITTIKSGTFDGYQNATVVIPYGVTTIESDVFTSNGRIIYFPTTLTSISYQGNYFDGMDTSVYFTIDDISTYIQMSVDVKTVLKEANIYLIDGETGQEITEIVVPNNITLIDSYALAGLQHVTRIVVPTTVTHIEYAFYRCNNLESLTLPFVGRTTLPNDDRFLSRVFGSSGALLSESVPESLKEVIFLGTCTEIPEYAFYECRHIESITIPSTCTSIGRYAFYNCIGLKYINISNGFNSIDSYAFGDGDSWSIHPSINVTIESIGQWLNIVENKVLPSYNTYLINAETGNEIVCVVIPDTVTAIPDYAFAYCGSIKSVLIPASVISIESNSFSPNWNIVEVINLSSLDIVAGTNSNGYVALNAKQVIDDPANSKIHISDEGFVTYEDGDDIILIGYIGHETDVQIPNRITMIDRRAFQKHHKVVSISIPSSVKVIASYAFWECENLRSVYIASGVETVGDDAFYNESVYCQFYCEDEEKPAGWNSEWNTFNNVTWGYSGENNE